jgi:Fe2+ transport system protein FeoA
LTTLDHATPNVPLKVASIASGALSARLAEMGLIPGQHIMILYRAPLGDPMAIEVGDYVLSLRNSEAVLISVTSE